MTETLPAYGLWSLVLLNSAVFLIFAFSFTRPRTSRDWRSLGAFSAFIVALFTEMYGIPLSIYLLSGWMGRRFPGLDPLSHDTGHLWSTILGWKADPHLNPLHLLGSLFIAGGFVLLSASWHVLHRAREEGRLATTGPYARIRHPQYLAFIAIMTGFLLQWPTILTLAMYPILVVMYARLARSEEGELRIRFGAAYQQYASSVPAFLSFRRAPGRAAPTSPFRTEARMKIDAKDLGFATALGVAAAFTLCTLVVAVAPGGMTAFLSYALHIDLTGLTRPLSWGGFVTGVLLVSVYFGLLGAAIAGIYNRRVTRHGVRDVAAGQRLREV